MAMIADTSQPWVPRTSLSYRAIWSHPMPEQRRLATRVLSRMAVSFIRNRVLEVWGLEHIESSKDPFILAINHSQKSEALYLSPFLCLLRQGRLIHFLADWNFCLIPGVAYYYRCGEVILVDRKPARPAFLNVFRPWITKGVDTFDASLKALQNGKSLGIFPEGTTNRDRGRLLRGLMGAAHLSLASGAPVVPLGIRFPRHDVSRPVGEREPFTMHIGKPLTPSETMDNPPAKSVRQWHIEIMNALADLSGKSWSMKERRK